MKDFYIAPNCQTAEFPGFASSAQKSSYVFFNLLPTHRAVCESDSTFPTTGQVTTRHKEQLYLTLQAHLAQSLVSQEVVAVPEVCDLF